MNLITESEQFIKDLRTLVKENHFSGRLPIHHHKYQKTQQILIHSVRSLNQTMMKKDHLTGFFNIQLLMFQAAFQNTITGRENI